MTALYATVALLVLTLGSGIWVALALSGTGMGIISYFHSVPMLKQLGISIWNSATGETMIALPLFILMAEILFRTKLADSLFSGLAPWVTWLPGKLVHTNIIGCTMFAAVSGSSAATTATVGRVTLGELQRRKYKLPLAMGSLAGAGTLGFLIPPSTMLIIYGVLAEESILKLFLAGVVPGLIIAGCYVVYVVIYASFFDKDNEIPEETVTYTAKDRLVGLLQLGPVVFLIILLMAAMYGGWASPTEAAAVGVLGSLLIALFQRCLTWEGLKHAMTGAARTSSMVGFIVIAAVYLSQAMAYVGVPGLLAGKIAALGLSPIVLIFILMIFYMFMGCIMEGLSIMVMTIPITLPLILQAGYDKIWFGIFLVLMVEMAQITPPVGFNLFVIQGITGQDIGRITRATIPFFLIMAAFTMLIAFFPQIVTYIPAHVVLRG
ncbi:MAG: TRAP transporter large permease subunit [Deltaproteobacteria bacterium]|nr:TRAP transporter large permease subunit [Deltaproteobacteria bacterium]